MAKRTYPAILEPAQGGGYGVSFPDLPGCVSFGATAGEAIAQAEEALSLQLEGLAEDGEAFPEPSAAEAALAGFEGEAKGAIVALITVEGPDAAERVNLYLPKSLLERIDNRAKADGVNRSALLVMAARAWLERDTLERAVRAGPFAGGGRVADHVAGGGPMWERGLSQAEMFAEFEAEMQRAMRAFHNLRTRDVAEDPYAKFGEPARDAEWPGQPPGSKRR